MSYQMIVLDPSNAWISAITQRVPSEISVHRALDLTDLLTKSFNGFGTIAVFHCPNDPERFRTFVETISSVQNHPQKTCWVAILDADCQNKTKILNAVGCVEVFSHLKYVSKIIRLAKLHWSSLEFPKESLEKQIENHLPWKQGNP